MLGLLQCHVLSCVVQLKVSYISIQIMLAMLFCNHDSALNNCHVRIFHYSSLTNSSIHLIKTVVIIIIIMSKLMVATIKLTLVEV